MIGTMELGYYENAEKIINIKFDGIQDGESALKESSNVIIDTLKLRNKKVLSIFQVRQYSPFFFSTMEAR